MRWLNLLLLLGLVTGAGSGCVSTSSPPKVIKVLPHFLDREGHIAKSPSLYDRDAYQLQLRENPKQRGGLRFDVQWRAPETGPLALRVDLRGVLSNRVTTATLEGPLPPGGRFSRWAELSLTGEPYRRFGEITAWRVTILKGDQSIAERHSFLW